METEDSPETHGQPRLTIAAAVTNKRPHVKQVDCKDPHTNLFSNTHMNAPSHTYTNVYANTYMINKVFFSCIGYFINKTSIMLNILHT